MTAHPELLRRNPDNLRRAWEIQAEDRADFILDALFAEPSLARDRTYLRQLREYLQDESVSPLAIRRLVQRHPEGVDPVFRAFLRKPGFSWQRDGEELLRRRKKTFFDGEPTPSISTVGDRLVELLRTSQ